MIINNIVKTVENRFREVTTFYKKVKMLLTTNKITLYKVKDEVEEQLGEEDSKWTKFCSELFEKDSMPDRIFDELLQKDYPIEEISFIWYEDISEGKLEELIKKSSMVICQTDGSKKMAFIFDKQEDKKVEVYIK